MSTLPEEALIAVQTLEDAGFSHDQAEALVVEIQLAKDCSVSQEQYLELCNLVEQNAKHGAELASTVARNAESSAQFVEAAAENAEQMSDILMDLLERVASLEGRIGAS